jgi:hypothetical protein
MEFILPAKKGAKRPLLIYGKRYKVYRDSKLIGIAVYSDDPIHGDVFLNKIIRHGYEALEVFCVDEWEFAD